MALLIESAAEILPGYRLLNKLGSGGYGEVWKCEAPGGLHKAIKIVHDEFSATGVADARTEQELTALRRVQAVRHPYLLSIERYDIIDGRLVIVTELADCNLWDRFTEFRQLRQAGIPRDDLLRYMFETAEVLDLMNNQYQLQHLDIKPQNLFLVHDHVKVADFGLVRDLDGVKRATTAGGATPVYAAPETFEGMITPYCDQYSLAIVYQELLTGKRPFSATNLQQLIAQHLQAAPDLNSLPPNDRAAVAKALAKRPEDRHASCREFVRGLMAGASASITPPPSSPLQFTVPTVLPSPDLAPAPWTGGDTPATQVLFQRDDGGPSADAVPTRSAPPEQQGDGVLFPSVVIGIGKLGLDVLQKVKLSITERIGGMERLPTTRLLYIDTDSEATQHAMEESATCPLTPDEVFAARLNRPAHYLKPRRNGRSVLEGWFDSQILYRIKAGNPLTLGLRCLGRLAFCDHFRTFETKLQSDLEAVVQPAAMDHAEIHSQLGMRSNRPRVYVIAGLGGGTGSGMFIDVAYTVRHHLRLLGYDNAEVIGLFLLPPHSGPGLKPQALGNTFAALTELNHFSLPGVTYTACIDDKDMTLIDQGAPFTRFCMIPLRSPTSQSTETPGAGKIAEYLWRELITPFGRTSDGSRNEVRSMPGVIPDEMTIAGNTFGLYAVTWPRRQLAERTARWLCMQLIENWSSTETRHLIQPVQKWAQDQWAAQKLNPEMLVGKFQVLCEQVAGTPLERYFQELFDPLAPRSRWARASYDSTSAFQALSAAVQLVGPPGEMGSQRQPGRLELALGGSIESAAKEWGNKVAQLAVCLIEQPDFRLAGAEVAVQTMLKLVEHAITHFEPQLRERQQQSEQACLRVQALIETDTRRKAGAEVAESLKQFALARYHLLLGRATVAVYDRLRDQLADSLKEISMCRSHLKEMLERLDPGPMPSTSSGTLLPEGCQTLQEAIDRCRESIDAETLRDLERQMQALIEKQYNSLVQVCLTSSEVRVNLETILLNHARRFMHQRLGSVDVTELYLNRYTDPERAQRAITKAFTSAEPWLDVPDAPTDSSEVLAVPMGQSCQDFLQLVAQNLPSANPTITSSPDDIIFYREQVTVPLRCLPHLGTAGRTAYQQMLVQQFPPHTRVDIRQWYDAG